MQTWPPNLVKHYALGMCTQGPIAGSLTGWEQSMEALGHLPYLLAFLQETSFGSWNKIFFQDLIHQEGNGGG